MVKFTCCDCILPMNHTPLPKHLCKYPLPWISSPVIILYPGYIILNTMVILIIMIITIILILMLISSHATGSSRPEVPPVAGPVFGHLSEMGHHHHHHRRHHHYHRHHHYVNITIIVTILLLTIIITIITTAIFIIIGIKYGKK